MDEKIYDEVSEEKYKAIVKGRLQKDDFVVDDGIDGYMDDGREDFQDGYESEEEEVERKTKRT